MKAVELWGPWGEGAEDPEPWSCVCYTPRGLGQPGWQGLGGEEEYEVIWEV